MTRDSVLQHALALSPDECVRLIDDLLLSMVDSAVCADLTAEQQAELLRWLEADRADPGAAMAWEEVAQRLTGSP